jgi:hypothetical protein
MGFPQRFGSPYRRLGVASILSVPLPGAGHLYCRRPGLALLWLAGVGLAYWLYVPLGLVLHLACVVSAERLATAVNQERVYRVRD